MTALDFTRPHVPSETVREVLDTVDHLAPNVVITGDAADLLEPLRQLEPWLVMVAETQDGGDPGCDQEQAGSAQPGPPAPGPFEVDEGLAGDHPGQCPERDQGNGDDGRPLAKPEA